MFFFFYIIKVEKIQLLSNSMGNEADTKRTRPDLRISDSVPSTLYPFTIAIKALNLLAFGLRLRKTYGFCKKDGSKRYNFE
jgi:hypothetical protein